MHTREMHAHEMRCTPARCTPVRCTPIRMNAHKTHVHEIHVREICALSRGCDDYQREGAATINGGGRRLSEGGATYNRTPRAPARVSVSCGGRYSIGSRANTVGCQAAPKHPSFAYCHTACPLPHSLPTATQLANGVQIANCHTACQLPQSLPTVYSLPTATQLANGVQIANCHSLPAAA